MQTPVLLLFFNRPGHAAAVMNRVRDARPARVYAHVDGPRAGRAEEEALVEACRDLVRGIDWPCEVNTLFREQNMGLRDGVGDALNWFFSKEEFGIVLEDDCLPEPSFFPYCEELLHRYRDDERIMHITGSNVAEEYTNHSVDSYFFSRFSLVWGWASWRRAWEKMSPGLGGLNEFEESGSMRTLIPGYMARTYMMDKFRVTSRRENNSWAYAWFYSILKNDGLCIIPKINLVENVGVGDADATNTRTRLQHQLVRAGSMTFPLHHPADSSVDEARERQIFYHTQKQKWRLFIWYLLRLTGLR
jgi:hypothetical protein